MNNYLNKLSLFINNSPSVFHVIDNIEKELKENGFIELEENKEFNLQKNTNYFISRNGSSIIAFKIGENVDKTDDISFNISASHSDSPTFKVKPNSSLSSQLYSRLSVEGYGGMLCAPWFDRPLSVAGRVLVKDKNKLSIRLVNINRDLLIIPSLAIHFNRNANSNATYNFATDMQPLLSLNGEATIEEAIARELNINKENIISHDLFLYNRDLVRIWGYNNEFISAPKLDDLECAYTTLQGFLEGNNNNSINVYCCFDNEEVGSRTRQGADSSFLFDILRRIVFSLGGNEETYNKALGTSFLVSADNAHAVHPNHPEVSDGLNKVYMNKGIVIKFNASQSYTTDGISCGVFNEICSKVNVPTQFFTNRADLRGGGTLGNISCSHVSIMSVDIGLPQLAMHSSYETAGVEDIEHMIKAMKEYYSTSIKINKEEIILK